MGDYTRFTHKPAKRYSGVLMQQGRVQLDADWNEEIEILKRRWELQAADTFGRCAVPKATTPQAFKIASLPGSDLSIGAGRMYVDGLLAELLDGETHLNKPVSYKNQPYYPLPPILPANAIVYLDVWDREVTYVEDSDLLEVALGGPDTTTRIQTVWQVKVYDMKNNPISCDSLKGLFPPSSGMLSTRAQAVPASDDPCIISPTGGYRGLENRLYRVEIQDPGTGLISTVRFKWSRDNASLVSSVKHIEKTGTQTLLTVSRIGRDGVLRFQADDWVEVLDDFRELMGQAGEMARVVGSPDEANLKITLDRVIPSGTNLSFGATDLDLEKRHTRIRKWDEKLGVDVNGLLSGSNTWIPLEDGVEIQFSPGTFKVGDFWVFAARTADGSVEELNSVSPRGIVHHYCQLATIIKSPGSTTGDSPLASVVAPGLQPVMSAPLHPVLPVLPPGGQVQVIDCRHLWPDTCGCCCIITVGNDPQNLGDFPDLESAVAALPYIASDPSKPVRICIMPGEYTLSESVVIRRSKVTISGCGIPSHITCNGNNTLVILGGDCCLESLNLTGDSDQPLISVSGTVANCRLRENVLSNTKGYALQTVSGPVDHLEVRNNIIVSGLGVDVSCRDSLLARNNLREAPLRLRVGCQSVCVAENEIDTTPDFAGVLLGSAVSSDTSKMLSEIDIIGNRILGAVGSGIATAVFDPSDVNQILVDGLRIVENQIIGCVGANVPTQNNAPTFGGIVLASANHLVIRDNRIENNGQNATVPVCGIYVAHSKGFEARGNHLLSNGPPWDGTPIVRPEGGILALDASVTTELASTPDKKSFLPGDGFPAALISVNTIVTQRGLPLYLEGFGPMVVQGNCMTSRALTQISPGTTSGTTKTQGIQVGAVVIWNHGTATIGSQALPMLGFTSMLSRVGSSAGTGDTVIADGRVQFLGNSVTLDFTQVATKVPPIATAARAPTGISPIGISPIFISPMTRVPSGPQPQPPSPFPAAVVIFSLDDTIASENQIQCHLGTIHLGTDLMVVGTTIREIGNGLLETPSKCSFSLYSFGTVNTCADNHGTHCIIVLGSLKVDRDNIVLQPDQNICPDKMHKPVSELPPSE